MKTFFIRFLLICALMAQGCGGGTDNQDVTLKISEPRIVKDIFPGAPPSSVTLLTEFKGKAYFFAVSDSLAGSRELWVSDGSPDGTFEITHEPNENFTFDTLREMVATDDALFFNIAPADLWVSDGTTEGTHVLLSYAADGLIDLKNLTAVGDTLFFTALGNQLWRTDGTLPGTVLVKEVNPGARFGARFGGLTPVADTLYFVADDGIHGLELWSSDGTPEGTTIVKDISPLGNGVSPLSLKAVNDLLFFSADDSIHGYEPWRSDGTEDGTWMIDDINEGEWVYDPNGFVEFEGRIYFNALLDGVGTKIWSTDLQQREATRLNSTSDVVVGTTPCSSILPLLGNDLEHGYELWRTDGTDEGTVLTKDINPGTWGSTPHEMTCFQEKLYFTAYNPDFIGDELMVSDGTTDGTYLLKDIEPYSVPVCDDGDSNPDSFTLVGDDKLFFVAEDCDNGRELWVIEALPAN